jgi:ABC-2 type transport system ATP-binding protein
MVVIDARDVHMRYGAVEALRGVDLTAAPAELVAVLGPNGAGKTTLVSILQGTRRATAGHVRVLGFDPSRDAPAMRARIGVVLQACEAEAYLSAREVVDLYRGYYPHPRPTDELLELVGLRDAARQRVRTLSGGQRRRLDVALALVGDPEVLFLDEPTTGFDPEARRRAWRTIADLRTTGTTIVLTTHYLDEAEALADRIVVLSRGLVVADGPAPSIGGAQRARARVAFQAPVGTSPAEVPLGVDAVDGEWVTTVAAADVTGAVHALTSWALARGVSLEGLSVTHPTLEDAYLELIA